MSCLMLYFLNMSDEQILITKSQAGDKSAFETLVAPYHKRIFNFLFTMCQNKEAAEDMQQEALINAFSKIKDFRGEAKFSTWVFQIATNHCRMLKRKNNRAILDSLDEPLADGDIPEVSDNYSLAEEYENKELRESIDNALSKIPEIYRAVIILKDIEGFSIAETAEMLKISVSNVKVRILRAREMLKKLIKS